MNSIGERLKTARTARGLTQERLAAGIATKGFISQVERNLTNPSLPRLRLLADRLGQPLSYFLEGAPPTDAPYLLKAAELAIKAHEARRALVLLDEVVEDELAADERADARRLRGMALIATRKGSLGLRTLQEAAALAPADDPALNAAIYVEIGAALGNQELFNASVEANMRALYWLDRCREPDLDTRARVLTNLANDWYRLGRTADAITYFEQALTAATDGENLLRIANAHMALGITARASGQLRDAMRHCDRALALHRRLGREQTANQILNNLADVHYAQGNVAEAQRLQQQCLERGRQTRDYVAVAAAAAELARYALATGDPTTAAEMGAEAEKAAERCGNHLFQARAVAVQGAASERQGRPGAADRAFRRAFEILRARNAFAEMAETCARYSDVLRDRGQAGAALVFMRMAYARDFSGLADALKSMRRSP